MDTSTHNDSLPALLKVLWVWFFVGVSQMSPLQWVQFIAAIVAIAYSLVQLWILVRDKIVRDKGPSFPEVPKE